MGAGETCLRLERVPLVRASIGCPALKLSYRSFNVLGTSDEGVTYRTSFSLFIINDWTFNGLHFLQFCTISSVDRLPENKISYPFQDNYRYWPRGYKTCPF